MKTFGERDERESNIVLEAALKLDSLMEEHFSNSLPWSESESPATSRCNTKDPIKGAFYKPIVRSGSLKQHFIVCSKELFS